jgi:hypothetical protein
MNEKDLMDVHRLGLSLRGRLQTDHTFLWVILLVRWTEITLGEFPRLQLTLFCFT